MSFDSFCKEYPEHEREVPIMETTRIIVNGQLFAEWEEAKAHILKNQKKAPKRERNNNIENNFKNYSRQEGYRFE